ncbi:hypothetical protein Tco_1483880 [Tanacetum coccineum]
MMQEPDPTPKKLKKRVQVRLHMDEGDSQNQRYWDSKKIHKQIDNLQELDKFFSTSAKYTDRIDSKSRRVFDCAIRLFNEKKHPQTRMKNGEIWKNHNSQELIEWKLYEFCGVHSLMLREVTVYMLVEKKYPLHRTLTRMLRWKLHVNYEISEMAYELLKFYQSQIHYKDCVLEAFFSRKKTEKI